MGWKKYIKININIKKTLLIIIIIKRTYNSLRFGKATISLRFSLERYVYWIVLYNLEWKSFLLVIYKSKKWKKKS